MKPHGVYDEILLAKTVGMFDVLFSFHKIEVELCFL